jgi:hypothetical protein
MAGHTIMAVDIIIRPTRLWCSYISQCLLSRPMRRKSLGSNRDGPIPDNRRGQVVGSAFAILVIAKANDPDRHPLTKIKALVAVENDHAHVHSFDEEHAS